MDVNFSINLSNVEAIYGETSSELNSKIDEIIDKFQSCSSYQQLKSSSILNFNGYIEGKKSSLFHDCIKSHYGIDNLLRELPFEIIDANTVQILSSIKKLSSYDNNYNELSDRPIIDYETVFNPLISKSNLNFNEAYTNGEVSNINYDTKYELYENEEELHFATPSSSVY